MSALTSDRCMRTAVRGAPHGVGDCIREMYADGKPVDAMALVLGLGERAVGVILEEKHVRAAGR